MSAASGDPSAGPPVVTGPVAMIVPRLPASAERSVRREMAELERQGVPVVLVAFARGAPLADDEPADSPRLVVSMPRLGRPVLRLATRAFGRHALRVSALVARVLGGCLPSPSALASTTAGILPALAAGERLRRAGVRHVHAACADDTATAARIAAAIADVPFSVAARGQDALSGGARLRRSIRAASFARCASDFARKRLPARAGDASPFELIRLTAGTYAEPTVPEVTAAGGARPLRVLCFTGHEPGAGIRHLIDAIALARDAGLALRCRVVGDGDPPPELTLRALRAGVVDLVAFVARGRDADMAELAACDVLVMPRTAPGDGRADAIPSELLDALAAGVPVIASRILGVAEAVRGGDTGHLVEPGDDAAIAQALRAIASDAADARSRARRGQDLVRAEHDLRANARRLASLFDRHGAEIADPGLREMARFAATVGGPDTPRVGLSVLAESRDAIVAEARLARPSGAARCLIVRRWIDDAGRPAPEHAAREHAALTTLAAEGLSVPAPLGLDAREGLVAMERAPGRSGWSVLSTASEDPAPAIATAGAAWFWLEQLRAAAGPPREAPAFRRDAVIARLRHQIRADAAECIARGLPRTLVRRISVRSQREIPDAVPRETCWTHGDFSPGHVIVDHRPGWDIARITVIGLGRLRPGVPLEDAAHFLEHVALALPSLLSLSRHDRVRERIESLMLVGGTAPAVIPSALRIAKALRIAANARPLVEGPWWRRRIFAGRVLARLLEVR